MSGRAVGGSSQEARSTEDGLAGIPTLLWAIAYKQFLLIVRYRVNFVGRIVGTYLFFAILFFGGQAAVAGVGGTTAGMDATLDGFIVGWFLFTMAQSAYFSLSRGVTVESEWGTFEQLYMSPYGFGAVMAGKVLVNIIESVFFGAIILILMLVTTGRTLTVDVLTLAPVIALGLLSIVGIGFVFAGLTLIYKKIQSFGQFIQFAIIGLIAAPVAEIPVLRALPLVQGSSMMQDTMRHGIRLWEFPTVDLAILVVVGLFYSLAGYAVFRYCSHVARKRGVMGHY